MAHLKKSQKELLAKLSITALNEMQEEVVQGNPLGVQITLSTGTASEGSLTVTLRHEPVKPNDGLESAGGETDISTSFDVSIQ